MAVLKYKRLSRKKTIKLFFFWNIHYIRFALKSSNFALLGICCRVALTYACTCLRVSGRRPNTNLTFWFWGAKRTDRAELKLSPSSLIYRRWRKPVGEKRRRRRRRTSLGEKRDGGRSKTGRNNIAPGGIRQRLTKTHFDNFRLQQEQRVFFQKFFLIKMTKMGEAVSASGRPPVTDIGRRGEWKASMPWCLSALLWCCKMWPPMQCSNMQVRGTALGWAFKFSRERKNPCEREMRENVVRWKLPKVPPVVRSMRQIVAREGGENRENNVRVGAWHEIELWYLKKKTKSKCFVGRFKVPKKWRSQVVFRSPCCRCCSWLVLARQCRTVGSSSSTSSRPRRSSGPTPFTRSEID